MTKEIDSLQGHTIVCGVGRMGTILARELRSSGRPFVLIDSDERRLHDAREQGWLAIDGDATDEFVLEHAGIRRAAVLATVLSDDATNVFVTITARELNPELMIIARGENPRTEKKLLGCGANKVVLPTAIGATKVAQLIIRPTAENMLDQIATSGNINDELMHIGLQFNELRVEPDSSLAGKLLSAIEVRSDHGFLIVGIRQASGATLLNPSRDTPLSANDVVILIGHSDDIPQLAERFSAGTHKVIYRGVTMEA